MVGDDDNRMGGSLDILLPFLQCKDYSEEFTIIDVIVPLSRDKRLREVYTWVRVAI